VTVLITGATGFIGRRLRRPGERILVEYIPPEGMPCNQLNLFTI
jgi:hypothetical protein